jgi:DNA-binding NarL/FixJ family response regulator
MSQSGGSIDKGGQDARSSGPNAAGGTRRRFLRLWMVDDDASFRQVFVRLLHTKPGLRVTRQFGSLQPMLAALAEERPPDIILLDLNVGKENGLSAIGPAKILAPAVKVLVLTTFNNTISEAEAFRLGASGFLLKIYELEELLGLIFQAFYHPNDPRLFPNLTPGDGPQGAVKQIETERNKERTGLLGALRQLWRPRRRHILE